MGQGQVSENADRSSDSSSRFAIYEKDMTLLQSTSQLFVIEIADIAVYQLL